MQLEQMTEEATELSIKKIDKTCILSGGKIMKFIVNRASLWNNERPCWEAVPETISYNYCGKQREENVWVVELSNLNELMKFKKKYGSLVVSDRIFGFGTEKEVHYDTITIYDDYLE